MVKNIDLHHRCSIVGDGLSAIGVHQQQISSVRSQRAFDRCLYRQTRVDVGDDLPFALRLIRP